MSDLPFQKQAALWGRAYEVLVKRGVLACLVEWKLLDPKHPLLTPWHEHQLLDVSKALNRALEVLDPTVRDHVKSAVEHMALTAYGVGYTSTREYLRAVGKPLHTGKLKLRALWCTLTLPGDAKELGPRMERERAAFHKEFGMQGILDEQLSGKGQPANADFVLWLSGDYREDYLLVQEYSFNMPREVPNFKDQEAHLDELMRHRRLIDNRSVFARITAEVDGESFELSEDIRHHSERSRAGTSRSSSCARHARMRRTRRYGCVVMAGSPSHATSVRWR